MSKIVLAEQSSAPDTPGAGKVAIYVDTDGSLCWRRDDGTIAKIAAAGTYSLTIPATGTAALRNVAQTFSAAQTFSSVLTAPGMKPASDSTTAIQLQNAAGTAVLTIDTTNSRVIVESVGIGNASNLLQRVSAGVMRQALEGNIIADNATVQISTRTRGLWYVENAAIGLTAIYRVDNAGATLFSGDSTYWGTAVDTASKINLYTSGGATFVQNKRGAANNLSIWGIS